MSKSIPGSLINADPALNADPSTTPGGGIVGDPALGGANAAGANAPGVGIGTGNDGMTPNPTQPYTGDGFSEPVPPSQFLSDNISLSQDNTGVDILPGAATPQVHPAGTVEILAVQYSQGDYNDQLARGQASGANVAVGATGPGGVINEGSSEIIDGEYYHGTIAVP